MMLPHQAHGVIGLTGEYSLHALSRRLNTRRLENGRVVHWSLQQGWRMAEPGADRLWRDMVACSDQPGKST